VIWTRRSPPQPAGSVCSYSRCSTMAPVSWGSAASAQDPSGWAGVDRGEATAHQGICSTVLPCVLLLDVLQHPGPLQLWAGCFLRELALAAAFILDHSVRAYFMAGQLPLLTGAQAPLG
jgi:hypothetical protein